MLAAIKRLTGFRWFERNRYGWEARFNWAEMSGGRGLALALCSFEDHFSLHIRLGWPNMYIEMPMLQRWHREPEDGMASWGFGLGEDRDYLHLNWGNRSKTINLPWAWDFHRRSILEQDGTWRHETAAEQIAVNRLGRDAALDLHQKQWAARDRNWKEEHQYRYVLQNGTVQDRTATIGVEEYEWRRRFLRWTRIGAKIRRSITVRFSDEVGERSGSWKGGTVGCSYDLKPGEAAVNALRRMEAERKF